jgi:DNA-directed RNA polymerase specialized sigma24 family protein
MVDSAMRLSRHALTVAGALGTLQPLDHEVVIRRVLQRDTIQQIASQLRTTAHVVRIALQRGLASLGDRLGLQSAQPRFGASGFAESGPHQPTNQ